MSKHSRTRARGDPKRRKSSIARERKTRIERRSKSSTAHIACGNGFDRTVVSSPPAICQPANREVPPDIAVPNPGNGIQNSNERSVEKTLPPQVPQNTFAAAQGMMFTSTIHFSGASFAIGSHFAQHGIAIATELELVGLATLGLSAALSGITLYTTFKMISWTRSGR
jgi:hypothetical protein